MKLIDKVALITGATRGIGKALAIKFAKEGADIAFTYNKNKEKAEELIKELKNLGKEVLAYQADVSSYERAKEVLEDLKKHFKKIHILVNNAGINDDKLFINMEENDWKKVIETNLYGTFNYSRILAFKFMKQKEGSILNIASVSGLRGAPGLTIYSASKAGIIGFTRSLSIEMARFNVNVNAIAPGFIETDMTKDIKNKEFLLKIIPSGKFGSVEDVANLAAFLVSDEAKYITGEVISIDGGLRA